MFFPLNFWPSNPATKILSLESDNLIGMLGIS